MRILALMLFIAVSTMAHGKDAYMSPLKLAFQHARAERNIDVVLPVFKAATLYVVVGSEPKQGQSPQWFLIKSRLTGHYNVTVSESEDSLKRVHWPKLKISGAKLLEELPPGIEILIVYPDGGDYITREHRAWYRQSG